MLPLFHKGSVKNIMGLEGKSPYVFDYSNRYSVFDWGEMPDELESKGTCLSLMADFFFKVLENPQTWRDWTPSPEELNGLKSPSHLAELKELGLKHHGLGLCDADGKPQEQINHYFAVEPVEILRPSFNQGQYDYTVYEGNPKKALVPLEVIFRFGIPEGSSLLGRAGNPEYCRSLGLSKAPVAGDEFDRPIIEFSTKLESTDRYIDHEEAARIAGLNTPEFNRLHDVVYLISLRVKEIFSQAGLKLWDGKFEFSFSDESDPQNNRYFWLVDSIGPDELRLTYNGVQLSKEFLRKYYRGSQWYEDIAKAKSMAKERGTEEWKDICLNELHSSPTPLSAEYKTASEMMYKSLTNALYESVFGKKIFDEAWSLDELVQRLGDL